MRYAILLGWEAALWFGTLADAYATIKTALTRVAGDVRG